MDLHSFPGCSDHLKVATTQRGQVDTELSFNQENIFLDPETISENCIQLAKEVRRLFSGDIWCLSVSKQCLHCYETRQQITLYHNMGKIKLTCGSLVVIFLICFLCVISTLKTGEC